MEQDGKISVIIPVYKVEKYLTKCLDSILAQTYTNFEAFLVDDGSTDNCPNICDEYAQKDKRFKVIHKKNGGLSSARNAALDIMTGKYVTFVDSDDWVEPTYLECLYKAIKEYDCDVSICSDTFWDEDGKTYYRGMESVSSFFEKKDCYSLFYKQRLVRVTAWGKLFTSQMFEKTRFPNGVNFEDAYILPELLANVKVGINVIDKQLYNYLAYRQGSISTAANERAFEEIDAWRHTCEVLDKKADYYPYAVELFLARSFCAYETNLKRTKRKDIIKRYNTQLKQDYKVYKQYLMGKARFRYMFIVYLRPLYYLLRKIKRLFKKKGNN